MVMWSLSSCHFLHVNENSGKIGPDVVAALSLTKSTHSNVDAAVRIYTTNFKSGLDLDVAVSDVVNALGESAHVQCPAANLQ